MPQGPPLPIRPAIASIEALPSELLFYLSRYLDLSSLIVFSTATSRALRNTFAQFDRELLFLEPAHRLNLSEWREAARQIDRIGLTPASCVIRTSSISDGKLKGEEALSETVNQLTRDESLIDLHLLQSVLAFLAGRFSQGELRPQSQSKGLGVKRASVNQIRCLHLTGWHGIAGAFLVQQLRTQPLLAEICTVVKTDRADSRIWEQAAADDRLAAVRVPGGAGREWNAQFGYETAPQWLGRTGSTHAHDTAVGLQSLVFRHCTPTQIIVQVGKRRPRRPEQPYLHGEGLQMGYQGYCIDLSSAETRPDQEQSEEVSSNPAEAHDQGLEANDGCSGQLHRKLHVILQGREVEDGNQNEEMFERSIVSCNHCKGRILF